MREWASCVKDITGHSRYIKFKAVAVAEEKL